MKHDFYRIVERPAKNDIIEIYPEFLVRTGNKDLMVRGGKFYAILDKTTGMWTTDEGMVQEFIDEELYAWQARYKKNNPKAITKVKDLETFRSRSWIEYKTYISSLPDKYHQLDNSLCFSNTEVKPEDYISKRLPYPLSEGSYESWNEIVGTLYNPEEREKIEWAIGSIISGDSKDIQKFVVLYGDPGAGKGTIIEVIKKLFQGYYEVFDAKSISNNSNAFAFEQFRSNPLVALQSDGDLSRIEDNTKINSLVSHETIVMNEKRKSSYNFTPHCFLFMASNKPVKITDAKSGIIRRLIDVHPSGVTIPRGKYDKLMERVGFELSGIAWHCLQVYRELGKNYYNGYRPLSMMYQTDAFFNFMEEKYDVFLEEDGICLKDAYEMWTDWCTETGIDIRLPRYRFREELRNYFDNFSERTSVKGADKRSWFSGFRTARFVSDRRGRKDIPVTGESLGLVLDQRTSLLDEMLKDCVAQYAEDDGHGGSKPKVSWSSCQTTLRNLDTSKLHFVLLPKNHIVIDFDLKNEKGEKDMMLNLEAADKWPKTYAEYSKSGKGIHLHYIYNGDPEELAELYDKDIEIKIPKGFSSLRRQVSLCNNIPVATLNGGLPKKEVSGGEMIDFEAVKDEKHIRAIVSKCLRKDIAQPYTAPAMSLIRKTLDDAYKAGVQYDIRDMRPAIRAFAEKSHHQKDLCMKMEMELKYCCREHEETTPSTKVIPKDSQKDSSASNDISNSAALSEEKDSGTATIETKSVPIDDTLVFFDIEVFPNLLLVNWKEAGEGKGVVRMINPTRSEIGELFSRKLVGFNCRRYDNHVLYARYLGYDNDAIYRLSQRIISGSPNAMFGNAYDISYTDVYDFAAKKQSLKKWEIELGIHHQELGMPWDQPVPEDKWAEVAAYCDNDVLATEAVFNELSGDFKARQILAEIAGMKVNDTTNQLTTRIIFGDDPRPQSQFNYPDLKKKFPGYEFENGKSYYRHKYFANPEWSEKKLERWLGAMKRKFGSLLRTVNEEERSVEIWEEIGEGGRVYASQGIHRNVYTFDVASMHPSSIIAENGFGKHTALFKQLLDIRIAIKHKDFESAKTMLDGKLARYLDDPEQADALSQALKIAINSVYGLTAAGFENKFRDPRNKDNWVAKRGALFIETLRLKVSEMGGRVVHIKTDSIKVENPTEEVKQFIMDYGKQYGYTFEIESIYEKMCLVNDAVYIALRDRNDPGWLKECKKAKKRAEENGETYVEPTRWSATGTQFQNPYVFKTLFSHEDICFRDLCETKSVTSALYLDLNENLSDVSEFEREQEKVVKRIKGLLKTALYSGTIDEWRKAALKTVPNPKMSDMDKAALVEEIEGSIRQLDILNENIAAGHNYVFIGKAGCFCPVKNGVGGGILAREKDGKYYAATGTRGFRWRESETLKNADRMDMIDMGYFENLAKDAIEAVSQYGQFEDFADENEAEAVVCEGNRGAANDISELKEKSFDTPPWLPPCGDSKYESCWDCPFFNLEWEMLACWRGYNVQSYLEMSSVDETETGVL